MSPFSAPQPRSFSKTPPLCCRPCGAAGLLADPGQPALHMPGRPMLGTRPDRWSLARGVDAPAPTARAATGRTAWRLGALPGGCGDPCTVGGPCCTRASTSPRVSTASRSCSHALTSVMRSSRRRRTPSPSRRASASGPRACRWTTFSSCASSPRWSRSCVTSPCGRGSARSCWVPRGCRPTAMPSRTLWRCATRPSGCARRTASRSRASAACSARLRSCAPKRSARRSPAGAAPC